MSHLGDQEGTVYENTNGMPLSDGRTLHMDLSKGQAANRILTVGAAARARLIAQFLDKEPAPKSYASSRGFETITGYFKGTHVSIISIGMGAAMMDFFVREIRAVVQGPMAIIRYGTCGGLGPDALPGTVVCASKGSSFVGRNYDYFRPGGAEAGQTPYTFCDVVPSDPSLSAAFVSNLKNLVGDSTIVEGQNVTGDSFYSSQGRIDEAFHDDNHTVIEDVMTKYPEAKSMEMETFLLFHLAACSKEKTKASSAAIVLANRISGVVVDGPRVHFLEEQGGLAALEALVATSLD